MRLAEFLDSRGIQQKALIWAIERAGGRLYQPDISRMIRGKLAIYPKARAALRAALIELHCDAQAVAAIVELREPSDGRG